MTLNNEMIDKIRSDIINKANRNKDRQAYIRPSEYGFGRNAEDTKVFLNLLPSIINCSKAVIVGKDQIDVTIE